MEIAIKDILFQFLGGLALFLFGIKYMSDGLQSVAGNRMRMFLEKGTKTPLRGVITGMLVTALIQSSSGTTVIAVGLVNAGLLSLRQAIGIIMGANIGTTVTAYLIGFELKQYALPIMAVGIALLFFMKNKNMQLIGRTLFGFGLLFYGLDVMGSGLSPLQHNEFFLNLMQDVEGNTLMGVGIGVIFTMVIQSSSATVGVLQEMAYQGAITYNQAVPILFGDNIGTTITALLASIGTTVAARRAALTHTLFNLAGTLIFLPLFMIGVFPEMVRYATELFLLIIDSPETWNTVNVRMQLAQTHGVFNIANMLIHLPFVAILASIVTRIIPGKDADIEFEPRYLEPRLLGNPSVALGQVALEVS
ncbi:MAG TPA: Na/Pi cotransporter family protein, partial [Clostridia bacterium]|nr:Na/Pi cotransporter family protein [Clostridia bacterium]